MFLMMYKCDCCILSFTSANTDNNHCDDVLMYDDGNDPSVISHPCTMYHRSWSTDDWHTADDEPKSHNHCSGRPPPLLVPILHHQGTHIHNAPIVFTEYSCHQHCWETFRLFSLFSRSVQLHHLSQLFWIFVHQHKSSHFSLQFCSQV